ncbi:XrtA/PEP-CTERM system-associated ATPase [Desulfohalovibrio reitneri]|uniref:XrtA/PEP-CTERM system-associated ATPase n=1 Tax=Desulfohalovibrio reitneri TaxID=1307759 RepID=UPI0004A72C23|nr:XrtA/PEP-CTERM system-associated ATPase [Desulfohalovibrio reitneri]
MYEEFFGLAEKPFTLLPTPKFLFPSRAHRKVLTYLQHGIRERAGFILLTGEVGSGKTTIIREIVKSQLTDLTLAKVFNTKVDSHQLLCMINDDFGLETRDRDKATLLRDLNEFLINEYAAGRQVVLIIDEAQNLTPDLLEEVRMLSNLETESGKLLRIIMVGQPELRETLARPSLLQLRQRIQINCHIDPLSEEEVEEYILYRLERAGNREALRFSPGAIRAIHSYSRGIPRLVNILCDYIMIDAYSAETRDVEEESVHELARDLSFESHYWEGSGGKDAENGEEAVAALTGGNGGRPSSAASRRAGGGNHFKAKLHGHLLSLSRRLSLLEEEANRCGQGQIVELSERVDKLEKTLERHMEEWRRPLRMEERPREEPAVYQRPMGAAPPPASEEPKKRGTMRLVWKFLWGE